jgi:hypothetical protein
MIPSAIGAAYRITLPSQGDANFEANRLVLPSLSSQFVGQIATLNAALNAPSILDTVTVRDAFFGGMGTLLLWLQNGHTHPLEAHGMSQVIFGLVGQDIYGYAP